MYNPNINHQNNISLAGEYRFVVRNAATGNVVRETDWMDNLITDAGLNRLGAGAWYGYCHIGTGTVAPANGDTALSAQTASTNSVVSSVSSNSGSPLYKTTSTKVYRFNAGSLNGNYTEVGISWANSTLWSRALIVDGGGSPTSITVTASEYLDVYYRLTMVPTLTDSTYSTVIGGVTYSVMRRAASVSSSATWDPSNTGSGNGWSPASYTGVKCTGYSGAAGAVTGTPSGTSYNFFSAPSLNAYSNNSFTRTGSLSFGLTDMNVGGLKTILVNDTVGSWQHEFTPSIPKDGSKIMSINVSTSWGRV